MRIDLQDDPTIPAGRELLEHLVGAHMGAADDEELFHMVSMTINRLNQGDLKDSLRILVHTAYYAQSLIVQLLDLASGQTTASEEIGVSQTVYSPSAKAHFHEQRLDLWDRLRDHHA